MDFLSVVGVNEQRQAVIVGSSFGGLLAVNVALQVRVRWRDGAALPTFA